MIITFTASFFTSFATSSLWSLTLWAQLGSLMSIRNTLASPEIHHESSCCWPPCDEVGAESAASGFAFSTIKVFDYVPFIFPYFPFISLDSNAPKLDQRHRH